MLYIDAGPSRTQKDTPSAADRHARTHRLLRYPSQGKRAQRYRMESQHLEDAVCLLS